MQKNSAGPAGHWFRRLVLSIAGAVCLLTMLAAQPSYAHDDYGYGSDPASTSGASSGASSHAAPDVSSTDAASWPTPTGSAAGSAPEEYLPADRDLLVKVRLAGLWETPAGAMAVEKGVDPRVREIGKMIGEQHKELDRLVVAASAQVGVPLPNEPNADQQSWLAEMRQASGPEFDHVFVERLRAAHGKVFPAIAAVRAGTRNPVVRELATRANGFVLMHLTLLESTGLVDFSTLPPPPPPSPTPAATAAAAPASGSAQLTTPAAAFPSRSLLWFVAIAGVAFLLFLPLNRRRTARRRKALWDGPQHRDQPSHRLTTPLPRRSATSSPSPIGRRPTHY